MSQFKSRAHPQRFLGAFSTVYKVFNLQRLYAVQNFTKAADLMRLTNGKVSQKVKHRLMGEVHSDLVKLTVPSLTTIGQNSIIRFDLGLK